MKQTYEEYLTEHHGEFNVYKFRLTNGHEIYLSEREQEELIDKLDIPSNVLEGIEEYIKDDLLIKVEEALEDAELSALLNEESIDIDLILEKLKEDL